MIVASRPRTCSTCWMPAAPRASRSERLTSLASEGWPVSVRKATSGCSARRRHDTQTGKGPRAAAGDRDRGTTRAVCAVGPHRSAGKGHAAFHGTPAETRGSEDSGNAPSPDALGTRVGRSPGANLLEVMGPSKAVGFDAQGQPTKAAIGFAGSQGVPVKALVVRTTLKGEYLFAVKKDPGRKTAALLPQFLSELVGGLSFPKAMRWNATQVRFARPVRWLLALYGGKPVRFEFAGLTAGDTTIGHRFLSSGRPIRVRDFRSYEKALEKAGVIVDPDRRRDMIAKQIENIAKQKNGVLIRDDALLEQAVFSVEMPRAIIGSFHSRHLDLPKAVLSTAMKEHQGYFPLLARDDKLLPYFVAVVNMRGSEGTIQAGNERVLAARLADAKFFFDEDRKTRLESRIEKLKGVTFHQKLGTLYQKVGRVTAMATKLADTLGHPDTVEHSRRAAILCKADLVTGMVGEVPTLQGIMGREDALHDGEPKAGADAIAA